MKRACKHGSAIVGDLGDARAQQTSRASAAVETVWHHLSGRYQLPPNEVHVWRATLRQPPQSIAALNRVLSSEEHATAARFHFEADSRRHIIGRAMVRMLVGRCLGEPAHALKFEYNEFGKPALAAALRSSLQFNVSHSGELVLVALARARALGVDVERMQSSMATAEIAARFFSPLECRILAELAPELQCSAFFSCWTRKEAYLKARGDGLSLALDTFDVAFAPGETPRLLETRHDRGEARRWTMSAPDPGYGCKAALAAEGADWRLKCWDWPSAGLSASPEDGGRTTDDK
jgi:4'-phosphopantetheinyl transferase